MSSLEAALSAAKAELEQLRGREAEQLERSGLRETVHQLTLDNQVLSDERERLRRRVDELKRELAAAREQRAMIELQIKGARARVQRLASSVRR